MTTVIALRNKPRLNKPVLVVGLPGVGSVGRMVARHLIKECKAERFATLYSDHLPHKTVMKKDGTLRLVNNRFYYIKNKKKGGNDIVLLTGDDQPMTPEGQYEVNKRIVNFFINELNGSFIYTIGGYNNPASQTTQKPKVFGNASDRKVVGLFKSEDVVFGESKGFILGSAGMIVAFAKKAKLPAICLMGEARAIDIDTRAAKTVTEMLSAKLGIKTDTSSFDKTEENINKMLNNLASEMQQDINTPQPHSQEDPFSYIR